MIRAKKKHRREKKYNGGFTLVELVTAALIMAVATVAIVSVIRMSTDMRITDGQRRTARAVIVDEFETAFAFDMFSSSYNVRGQVASVENFPWTSEPVPVTLEVREVGQDVIGNMTVTITEDNIDAENIDAPIPAHRIEIKIDWTDAGREHNVTLVKRLMEINLQ